jgi:hypothetical protein
MKLRALLVAAACGTEPHGDMFGVAGPVGTAAQQPGGPSAHGARPMTHAIIDHVTAPQAASRGPSLLHAARVALFVAAAGAICRLVIAIRPGVADGPNLYVLRLYGAILLIALTLQWGVGRRGGAARWSTVVAGMLMAVALIVGRGALVAFWHHLPMPPVEALLFAAQMLIIIGFVVAGICCAVALFDTARQR